MVSEVVITASTLDLIGKATTSSEGAVTKQELELRPVFRVGQLLETIPGLGPVKRRELLKQFGGLQGILRAGVEDFVQIRGLGRELAEVIYEHLHPGK